MSKRFPGIITIGEHQCVNRLWDLGYHNPDYIAEALELTRYEVLYVLKKSKKHMCEAFHLFDLVEKVTDIHVVNIWEDDHLPNVAFFFKDEKNRLRYAEILYNEIGPGMVNYAPYCQKAHDDLVEVVNDYYYQMKSEEES